VHAPPEAFSGKVDTGFPSANATTQKSWSGMTFVSIAIPLSLLFEHDPPGRARGHAFPKTAAHFWIMLWVDGQTAPPPGTWGHTSETPYSAGSQKTRR
jgi:hypothetical protein